MKKQSNLAAYQSSFRSFVLGESGSSSEFVVKDVCVPKQYRGADRKKFIEKRLAIYRNNVSYSLSEALGKLYPVVKRLIGEDCFSGLALSYIQTYPPEDPALTFYGEYFSEFIKSTESCAHLLYLSDVALLEWQCQLALHAADKNEFDPTTLGGMNEEELVDLKLFLHPSAQFMISDYPIEEIWSENQKAEVKEINISEEAISHLLIYRKGFDVQVVKLQPLVFDLLTALAWGQPVGFAWDGVKDNLVSDDELFGIFGYLLGLGVFCEVEHESD